jgi:hypothetical protein
LALLVLVLVLVGHLPLHPMFLRVVGLVVVLPEGL